MHTNKINTSLKFWPVVKTSNISRGFINVGFREFEMVFNVLGDIILHSNVCWQWHFFWAISYTQLHVVHFVGGTESDEPSSLSSPSSTALS